MLNDSIEKLRKKSQTLLARVDKHSKRVNAEVKKLHSQTLSLTNCHNHKSQDNYVKRNTNLWKLRNDSSEISAILCPDYFCVSPKRATASAPNMISSDKVTLTSKKPGDQCLKLIPRKPVKGCYCCSEVSRIPLRSSRTLHQPTSPCRCCRSQLKFRPVVETDDKMALTSPISCETFRRIKKIDYTPRSQFLRNVQGKICELQTGGQGDCVRTCPRSSSYHRFMANAKMQDTIPNEKGTLPEHKHVDEKQKPPTSPRVPANSLISEQSDSDRDNVACTSNRRTRASSRKLSKSTLRKTIRSRRQVPESSKRPTSPAQDKRAAQLLKLDCPCCRSEPKKRTAKLRGDRRIGRYELPEYCELKDRCLRHDDGPLVDNSMDQEVENMRKFREQNYFETHGSNHTLTSSRSSGSLEQYLLNERLFAEPVGRIHRKDLVVTIPPCATKQKQHIHYFPRHIVRQEKNISNLNYKRKRCQSCPLTGHAIDLGILKAKPPLNSLALKHQSTLR